jgi:septum formation protein
MSSSDPLPLILASGSPYRKLLLSRLGLPFTDHAPDINETALTDETAAQTSLRLSITKAKALSSFYPAALIIGSDQVALLGKEQLGKPGTHEKAVQQLQKMRGQCVTFYTSLCLYNSARNASQSEVITHTVTFREYTDREIERYVKVDTPYDCAGSAKIEGLGITLIAEIKGSDPNALIGLPLIALTTMLKNEGVLLP